MGRTMIEEEARQIVGKHATDDELRFIAAALAIPGGQHRRGLGTLGGSLPSVGTPCARGSGGGAEDTQALSGGVRRNGRGLE